VNRRRSPFFYVGDKYKLLDQILPRFPDRIETYFEPFLGGGSMALNVDARHFVLSDRQHELIEVHKKFSGYESPEDLLSELKILLDRHNLKASFFGDELTQELRESHPKTYFAVRNRESFNSLREFYNQSRERDPLVLYLLVIFGFNRLFRFNLSGHFNVPVGNVDFNAKTASAIRDYVTWAQTFNPSFSSADFQTVADIDFQKGDFIYFDPPYLIAEAEYNKSWKEQDEISLLGILDELDLNEVRWALSNALTYRGRRNTLLWEWSKKYNVHHLQASYLNYHNNLDKISGEVLITNYA
jgi:DNA adenine methylase